jgi:hypothetical protein
MEEDSTNASEHQKTVRRALEGNERVWFHPFEDKLAIWYGGPQITIVSSRTFEDLTVVNIRSVGRTFEEMEVSAEVKVARRGFDRKGHSQNDTRLVGAE